LGCGYGGVKGLKGHQFFSNINWADLEDLYIDPPYKPPVKNDLDTCMIDDEFMNEENIINVFNEEPSEIEMEKLNDYWVPKFTYINKDEIQKLMARQAH